MVMYLVVLMVLGSNIFVVSPSTCECGWKKESRIINGQETGFNEFPMMVGLVETPKIEVFCGGTIISNKYVLTAAHCLFRRKPSKVGNLIGTHEITKETKANSSQLFKSERFIGHPGYDQETYANDIALIEVEGSITFSLEVGPACLPFSNPDKPSVGEVVTVLGWGTTKDGGSKAHNVLQKTELDVIDISECQEVYEDLDVTDKQICTFRKGTDACQSDSGGPVFFEGDRVRLEGFTSYGLACAKKNPAVDIRVGKYLQWIQESTPGETYCERSRED